MRGEYTHNGTVKLFAVAIEPRDDGTTGPPYRRLVSERSCPNRPAEVRLLEYERYDAERDVAIYRVAPDK
jgi:hypothetical protein